MRNISLATALTIFAAILITGCEKEESGVYGPVVTDRIFTEWPAWNKAIHYDFNEITDKPSKPEKNLPYSSNLYKSYSGEYWSFFVGNNANPLVKDNETAAMEMLKRLDADFSYISDVMGWPRDLPVQKGYRSAVFLFGSGLTTDNASNEDKGGWQSAVYVGGKSWPIILASYYPVYCFDPECPYADRESQMSAMVHEGIHAVFASMPGCRKASWFHEGANCWLQATMTYEQQYGKEYVANDFGWLSMGSILAPFQPIECYSGWLTDGTFGGPGAEGVNGAAPTGNVRAIIGGSQYSEVFPTFLGEIVDYNAVPWVWMNCTGYVLEGIANKIGADSIRTMIQEYRARLTLCDFGKYSQAVNHMYNNYMGTVIESESWSVYSKPWRATPYQPTTVGDDGWLVPDPTTTPGWSGANIIPIDVESSPLTVSFKPYGELSTTENMSCQLCYRTKEGVTVYSQPFSNGSLTLNFDKYKPANGVVFAVVCNLDYKFTGNTNIRKNHYDYRLKLSKNAHTANVYGKWFNWDQEL
jgi:hypothetical protein